MDAWARDYLKAHKAEIERALDLRVERSLGCGTFGCALAVKHHRRSLVLKLTVDRDEALMWGKLVELLGLSRIRGGGLVRVYDVGELSAEAKVTDRLADLARRGLVLRENPAAKAYVILRDNIHPLVGSDDHLTSRAEEVIRKHGTATWGLFARAVDHLFAAGRIWNEIHHNRHLPAARRAVIAQSLHEFVHKQVRVRLEDISTEDEALAEVRVWIAALRRVPYATDLADTLEDLAAVGIIFADLKLDNIGFREGTGVSGRQVVIFDAGGTPLP